MPANSSTAQQALDVAVNLSKMIGTGSVDPNDTWVIASLCLGLQLLAQSVLSATPSAITASSLTAVDVATTSPVQFPTN